jgi:hypothetical protein
MANTQQHMQITKDPFERANRYEERNQDMDYPLVSEIPNAVYAT